MSKQTNLTKDELVDLYLVKHLTMEEIARPFKVTRQCIFKALKRYGIDTTRAERFEATCDHCGKLYSITRSRFNKQRTHYCSDTCYYTHKASILPGRTENRHAKRIARAVMENHLKRPLVGSECVHHIDGDQLNNHIDNLMLFASHSEHLRFHHQMRIVKALEGRD